MFNSRGIERYHGARAILDGVSVVIGEGERVGLVGRNGCGKSTLLRILAGLEAPDKAGSVATRKGMRIGYLPQAADLPPNQDVLEAATMGLSPGVELWEVRRALFGLGFTEQQLRQRAGTLSGGERTRLMLARLIADDYDLLLLDEPTNHLDIRMLSWLEEFLREYRGAFLVASHDRRFLDNCVGRILELDSAKVTEYTGGYTAYAAEKQRRVESQKEDYILQQRQIRALREFVSRKLGWAAAAQGGPKRGRDQRGRVAEKLARQAHAAERRIERIPTLEKPRDSTSLSASISPQRRSGQIVFELRGVSKSYGARKLFNDLDLTVSFGDRIGIIGSNGAGKSTLVKLLMGCEEPDTGTIRRGSSIDPWYLAQEQEQLDPSKTVLDTIEATGQFSHTEARTLLACFLFREDEVFKRVKDLSGGERARLAAASAAVSGANFLALDEPSNNLDIDTRERLESALETYAGTMLVVSHDRYQIERLCNQTWILGKGDLSLCQERRFEADTY